MSDNNELIERLRCVHRFTLDELSNEAADALEAADIEITRMRARVQELEAGGEPVKFLLDGARFKLSFSEEGCDECGAVDGFRTACRPLDQYTKELQGQWVALVDATNDAHLKYTAPQPAQEVAAWMHEDELPDSYPYDLMYPYSKVDVVRMFPIFAPQPAQEPVVKVSDVLMIQRLTESGKLTPDNKDGWVAALESFQIAPQPAQEPVNADTISVRLVIDAQQAIEAVIGAADGVKRRDELAVMLEGAIAYANEFTGGNVSTKIIRGLLDATMEGGA